MKSKNRNFGALRALNWLFMVVNVLMAMTILYILGEDEDDKVKDSFSKNKIKKSNDIFVNNSNF